MVDPVFYLKIFFFFLRGILRDKIRGEARRNKKWSLSCDGIPADAVAVFDLPANIFCCCIKALELEA
jgi:hypothetical protein